MPKKSMLSEAQKEAILEPLVKRKTPPWNKKNNPEVRSVPALIDDNREPLDVAGTVVTELAKMPDLNKTQREIAYFLSHAKYTHEEIAIKIGCSKAYVSRLASDSRVQRQMEIFRGGEILEFAEAISAQEIMDRASVRAAEIVAEKMNDALDEKTQLQAAIKILSLTGHTDKSDGPAVQIVIDHEQFSAYKQAVEETNIQTVDFEIEEG